jgi:hypothetical protein
VQQAQGIAKSGAESIIEKPDTFSRKLLFVPHFFCNLVPRKSNLLRSVEIELFVPFCPSFANTFSVVGNALTTRQKNEAIIQAIKNNYI